MKNKSIICMLLAIIMIVTLVGCGSENKEEDTENTVVSQQKDDSKDSNQENTENKDSEEKEDTEEIDKESNDGTSEEDEKDETDKTVKEGIPSPLSGIYGKEEKVNRRPVAVMYDNHPKARWQAGLGQAEIVYEFRVEYPYTRYMAIFLVNDPERIGPIRSSRPYFVTTLLEYDPVYVRVGGSEEAKAYIKRLNLADIDGLYSGAFWRYYKTDKKAPNNMYSTMEKIRAEQKRKGYRLKGSFESNKFNEVDTDLQGMEAPKVFITYNKHNNTEYKYDKEEKIYKRYKDGKLHLDELDNSTITTKNIIIQKTNMETIDNIGRLQIDVLGTGKGYYITNGKAIEITWKKESETSKTKFYNNDGEQILFNSGNIWVQVVPLNTKITFK